MEDELHITLTNDYAFKRLLGSEENKPILQDLLQCILGYSADEISGLELMDKELTKEELGDKTGILDVKLKLRNGTVIDIEISFSDRHPCLSENTSFAVRQNIATAWNDGWKAGIAQGKSLGLAEGTHQKALETARILKQLGDSTQKIVQVTGLTSAEVEAIK